MGDRERRGYLLKRFSRAIVQVSTKELDTLIITQDPRSDIDWFRRRAIGKVLKPLG